MLIYIYTLNDYLDKNLKLKMSLYLKSFGAVDGSQRPKNAQHPENLDDVNSAITTTKNTRFHILILREKARQIFYD